MGNLKKATMVVVLGVFIVGATFGLSLAGCDKEDGTMGIGSVPAGEIPAIDVSAPVRTETATFALG